MQYITCDDYNGTNTPERFIDFKSYFVDNAEPTLYGNFSFPNRGVPFNGNSYMRFQMDLSVLHIKNGNTDDANSLGDWIAGYGSSLHLKSNDQMMKMKTATVYRVLTVVVSFS